MKLPLMIGFKNGVRTDWTLQNLQWLCYNCSFILGMDYFSNRLIRDIESYQSHQPDTQQDITKFYEIDEFYLQHLSKLGLDDKGDILQNEDLIDKLQDPEDEFIDRV
jgi:hypothetical protein